MTQPKPRQANPASAPPEGKTQAPPPQPPPKPLRPPRVMLWVGLLVVAFLAVTAAAVVIGEDLIEDALKSEADDRLAELGIDGVEVEFTGREARLGGTVNSLAERDDARALFGLDTRVPRADESAGADEVDEADEADGTGEAAIEPISGVRSVKDEIRVERLIAREPGPKLKVQILPPKLRLTGNVRDADDFDVAHAAARQVVAAFSDGRERIIGLLEVDVVGLKIHTDADEAPFLSTLPDALQVIAGVGHGQLEFDNSNVTVRGEVLDDEARSRVITLLTSAVFPLEVNDRLTIGVPLDLVAKELGGAYLNVAVAPDTITLTGKLPTQDDIDLLQSEIAGITTVPDHVADGEPPTPLAVDIEGLELGAKGDAPWLESVDEVLRIVAGVGDGTLQFENSKLTVSGLAVDSAARDRIVTMLGSDLEFEIDDAALRLAAAVAALGDGTILFDVDSASIRDEGRAVIAELANAIKANPGQRYDVVGRADSRGTESYNQDLSERRARAVVDALVALGVPADQLTAVGRGETDPLSDNDTETGRTLNRRVIVIEPQS